MKIPLSKGLVTVIDAADGRVLAKHRWFAMVSPSGRASAARWEYPGMGKQRLVLMHHLIPGGDKPGDGTVDDDAP